jgi:hypothetical protein
MLAAVLAVVTLASSALAGCAWVLWTRTYDIDTSLPPPTHVLRDEYTLVSPHETRQKCREAGRRWLRDSAKPWRLKEMGFEPRGGLIPEGYALQTKRPSDSENSRLVQIEYECWPDVVDPRAPKGSGR